MLCQKYGAIGSAIGTAISLIVANGIIMNIYYQKKCNIDILYFWSSIRKLSVGLIIPTIVGIGMKFWIKSDSLIMYLFEILLYVLVYVLSMWKIGMNEYEKRLFSSLVLKIFRLRRS